MEKIYLNHRIILSSNKVDKEGNECVQFHYEGKEEDCMMVIEMMEKCIKDIHTKLGKQMKIING